ncbi:hypothetical protein PybrP1_003877 [[Pythium] brassicae (nom. inval.)]|nr:hypothetical protein PybrP1_003877 [[Pythium] brassicae (nom. inval.)]
MKSTVATLAVIAVTICAIAPSATSYTNPVTVKGYKMFDAKTGKYFSARGIAYYPRPNAGELDANNIDFFTDDHYDIWSKDIEHLAATGANAVRLYAVNPTKSHDMFMCALRTRGMYALIDLAANCEGCAITKDKYPTCYPPSLKDRGEQIILAFAKYDNVLGFSAGNEANHIVTDASTNAPCQKKFLRDMRKFVAGCASTMRPIPVGVVAADSDREENAKYYNCRTDTTDTHENAEWYGLNAYQHCDGTVTDVSKATGFSELVSTFLSYKTSIPVMLTEFGCLDKSFPTVDGYAAQRTWLQAGWLFTKTFRQVFSGGFVFEFSTENANSKADSPYPFTAYGKQNYGLGYYQPATCDHNTTSCVYTPMPNYKSLATQYNATDTSDEALMATFTPESDRASPPACPSGFPKLADITWEADSVESLSCPRAASSFVCPRQESSGVWTGNNVASGSTAGTATGPTTGGDSTTSAAAAHNVATFQSAAVAAAIAVAFASLL